MNKYVILISIDGMAHYNFKNTALKMPILRSLMNKGTAASGMKATYPTITWSLHSSIITGTYPKKHGVLGNRFVDKKNKKIKEAFGDRDFSKDKIIKVPTLYDVAHQHGWTTASICWPLTKGAKHIDYNIPEFYEQALFEKYCTKGLWHELAEYGLPIEKYGEWSTDHARGHMQDWLSTEVAKYLIETHKPNFMMLHYLLADSMQHGYGIHSPEADWSLEYIDERIGDLIEKLKDEGIYENTDIFVISDHGFAEIETAIFPNVLFEQNGWLDQSNPEQSQVLAVSNGGAGFVSILEEDKDPKIRGQVKEKLVALDGIEAVFENKDFPGLGLPTTDESPYQPDFIIEAKDGYYIDPVMDGKHVIGPSSRKGMHGYLPQKEQLKAIFVAHGPNIIAEKIIPEISITDVAPTIARIMGLPFVQADGKVLESIVKAEEVKQ